MENKVTKINQKNLIDRISTKTGFFKQDIETIFDALEEECTNLLVHTQDNETVEIKLFNGLKLFGMYTPERVMKHNVVSKLPLKTPENVVLSAKFTHGYKEKVKTAYRNTKGIV